MIMTNKKMSAVIEEYFGIFPTILFACFNEQYRMHFVMCLKNTVEEESQEIMKLMTHCGADVTCDVSEATEFSVIIVDHEEIVPIHAPAFTLDYVRQCFKMKRTLDVSAFRQKATALLVEDDCCMQVVYFRLYTWDSTLTTEQKNWIDACSDPSWHSTNDFANNSNTCKQNGAISKPTNNKKNIAASETITSNQNVKSAPSPSSAFVKNMLTDKVMSSTCIEAHQSEDSDVEEWSEVAVENCKKSEVLCDDRSETHLNEGAAVKRNLISKANKVSRHVHLKSKMDSNIPSVMETVEKVKPTNMLLSDDEDSENFNEGTFSNSNDERIADLNDEMIFKRANNFHASKARREWIDVTKPDKSSSHVDETAKSKTGVELGEITSTTSTRTGWIKSKESSLSSKTSTKWVFPKDFENDDDEDDEDNNSGDNKEMPKPIYTNKRTRRPYTAEEREIILKYIVQHNEFSRLKGREMWMTMERRKVCHQRTWQSMKEHFLKKIIFELDQYSSLTKEDIRKIKSVCF